MRRVQESFIVKDLNEKIVFLSGPRQVGKTTLALNLKQPFKKLYYLNYDASDDRRVFIKEARDRTAALVVFDEIHKHKNWKTRVKGIYDTEGIPPRILITGSARLDIYRRGGDSMSGRYFRHRLLPLSIAELKKRDSPRKILDDLLVYGGFPEPFLGQSARKAKRWRKNHIERIIREDVRDLEPVRDIQSMILLVDLLRERVGSPVSFSSLARDIQVSPHTIKRWIEILENMYVIFRVKPWHKNIARAILKEPKIYFYDIGQVIGPPGAVLENLVAVSILKHLWFLEDTGGMDVGLYYLRDKEKREVDFLIQTGRKPQYIVEVKSSETQPAAALTYFKRKLSVPAYQIVQNLKRNMEVKGILVRPVSDFLAGLRV